MFAFAATLRGRLMAAVGLGVLCFLGALSLNQTQMRHIGAALQLVDTVYLPLARLSVAMGGHLEPGSGDLSVDVEESRRVTRRASGLTDPEETAALAAITRQLDDIAKVSAAPGATRAAVREEVVALGRLVDGRIAAVSEKTALAQRRAQAVSAALLGLAGVLGAALLWLTGSALRPVTALTQQVRRLAAGERPAPIPRAGTDEIATLSRAFEQMAQAVEDRDRNLQSLTLYLRRVLDSIAAAVVVVDEGRVRLTNPAARALWGVREGEALPDALATLDEGRHAGLRMGERVDDVRVQPFGDGGRILVGEDVTERIRDRERLERSERLALVGQMLAQVTHEVRNPLNAMSLHAELLAEEVHTESERGLLRTILSEIRRLESVTERYLDLARHRPAELVPEDPVELARGVLALEDEALRRAGIAARVEGPEGLSVEVDGNALRRALLNLVQNAAEAGATHVTVRVAEIPGAVELRVEDDGPGMDPGIAERIFDPFFSTRARGTGLGLAITRQTLDDLGGTVRCETLPGQGTTFVLRIPR